MQQCRRISYYNNLIFGGWVQPVGLERLDGWKNIAGYLKRTTRTVQRWEKLEGLPVHRLGHSTAASVFAYPAELDAWWNQRKASIDPPETPKHDSTRLRIVVLTLAGTLVAGGIASYLSFRAPQRFSRAEVVTPMRRGNVEIAVISPDGKSLAYAWGASKQNTLTLPDLASGEERILVQGMFSRYYGLTFSRDGTSLHIVAQRPGERSSLYRVQVVGGAVIRVVERIDSPITLSPLDNRMAFVRESGESQLVVARTDGTGEKQLLSRKLPEYLDYPAWSPDGKSIIASLVSGQGARLIVVDPDTGAERPVGSQVWDFLRSPVWLDRNTLAVSLRVTRRSSERLFTVSYTAGKAEPISLPGDRFMTLSASSDGRSFAGVLHGVSSSIWTTDGSAPLKEILAPVVGTRGVAWNGSGRLLVGGQEISSVTPDGTELTTVLSGVAVSYFSVCGSNRLIYNRSDPPNVGLWQTTVPGRASKLLAANWHAGRPHCSPDGNWVLYSDHWAPAYQIPTNGGAAQLLIADSVVSPAVSWDNQWIAAYRSKTSTWGDPGEIAIYPRTGGRAAKILPIRPGEFEWTPLRWTRDNRAIGYIERTAGVANLWLQPLDGGPRRQATHFQGGRVTDFDWSPDGRLALEFGTRSSDVYVVRDLGE